MSAPTTPDPDTPAKSIAIQMGGVSRCELVVYTGLPTSTRAYFCKSVVIQVGGASQCFSKVSLSGVDVTLRKNGNHNHRALDDFGAIRSEQEHLQL